MGAIARVRAGRRKMRGRSRWAAVDRASRRQLTAAARLTALAVLAAGAALAPPASAQGLRRLDAAWPLPARLGTLATAGAPSPSPTGLWARAAQSRLYGRPELPARRLAVGIVAGRGAWAVEGAWEALGAGVLRDNLAEARLQAGRAWTIGAAASRRSVQAGAAPAWRTFALNLELGRAWEGGPVGAGVVRVAWPLADGDDDEPGAGPTMRLLVALAAPGRALAVTVDTDPTGRPHVGWEALCALSHGVGLAWRADPASGAVGGGLRLDRGRLRLRTSHLVHPDLGLTHRCELAIGAVGVSPW